METQRSFFKTIKSWQARNRYRLQVAAFLAGILLPFLLFWSLNVQLIPLAVIAFCLIAASMLVTAWAG